MKQVLLCSFYFVPRNCIASYRTGCFAKYLVENGWMPTVICQDWPVGSPNYDPDFVGKLPDGVTVIRVPNPVIRGFYARVVERKLFPYFQPERAPIHWWRRALGEIMSLLKKQSFDAVWGTSDPLAPLGLAQVAARRLGVGWVADIRDSYNAQHFSSWYKRPGLAYREGTLCRAASHVTTVSDGLAEAIQGRCHRSVEVINNGFDPALFENQPGVQREQIFRVVFSGTLAWPRQDPTPFFQALDLCLRRGAIPAGEIEVCFYGADLREYLRVRPGICEHLPVRILARIPHRSMISILQATPVLLVLSHVTERGVLPAKIFDYLGAGRAILSVPDDHGEVKALLDRTGAGVAATHPEEIAAQLTAWFRDWKAGNELLHNRKENEVARYSRREQTRRLAGILYEVSSRPRAALSPSRSPEPDAGARSGEH